MAQDRERGRQGVTPKPNNPEAKQPNPSQISERCRRRRVWTTTDPLAWLGRSILIIGALSASSSAEATVIDDAEIPTILVLPTDHEGRPSPVCSQCKAATKKTASASSDTAQISFTFFAEYPGGTYEGAIRVTVQLLDGTSQQPYEAAASLDDGETLILDVTSEGWGFEWDEVDVVYFALLDASSS